MMVLLATNNDHKRRELAHILAPHEVVTPAGLGLRLDYDETGDTFLANAMGKARALQELHRSADHGAAATGSTNRFVVIADDSGLCVDALGGAPGVYSARYGSPDGGKTELPSPERNRLLLTELAKEENRNAHFVCCMVALFGNDRYAVVEETFEGIIAREPSGDGGFGYDPVFFLPERNLSVAQLPDDEKNRISHRGRAARAMAKLIAVMGDQADGS